MEALALVLALMVAQPDPLEVCELARRANLDDALTWEGRAEEARAGFGSCLARLAVRTSTPAPSVVEFRSVDDGIGTGSAILGGIVAFLLGTVTGLLVAQAAK